MGSSDKSSEILTTRPLSSDAEPSTGLLQLVGFHVESEEFCLDIQCVQEIIRFQQLTRVPNSPDFVEGVMNLRGRIVPVVALRRWFGLNDAAPTKDSRIVVVEAGAAILGFVVDSVSEVLRIPSSAIEPPPRIGNTHREYVSGVAKINDRLLIILDVPCLIRDAEALAASEPSRRQGVATA